MILAFAEQRDSQLKKVAFEALLAGYKIAQDRSAELGAVVIGSGIAGLADEIQAFGVQKVLTVDDPRLEHYTPEGYAGALAAVASEHDAEVVVLSATSMGKDLAAALAARLEARAVQDCVGVEFDKEGALEFVRPVYAGKALSRVAIGGPGRIVVSFRPRSLDMQQQSGSAADIAAADVPQEKLRSRVAEIVRAVSDTVELTEADVIVSGGRGMKGAENYPVLHELARVIGAAVGASRAAVDAGWRDHQDQVGQTGKVVAPTVYIACGISGAIQHLVGMTGSKCIVAINKDPEANIFKVADYGIVGDLFKIVPLLTEEFGKLKQG